MHPNQRLAEVDAKNPSTDNYKDVIPETENVLNVSTAGGYIFAKLYGRCKNGNPSV